MELDATERDNALHELLEKLVEAGRLEPKHVDPILVELVRRETLGTTAIGRSMALPHARLKEVSELTIALGLSRGGIEFHALDGLPVRVVFLIIGPETDHDGYLKAMKTVSNMTQSEDFRRFLFKASTPEEIADLVREMSAKMR